MAEVTGGTGGSLHGPRDPILSYKFGGSSLLDLDGVGVDTLPTAIPTAWAVVQDADVKNTSTSHLHNGAMPNGGFVGFCNTS